VRAQDSSEPGGRRFSKQEKWLLLFFLLSLPLVNPWVRGDGVGYYAYVRSFLVDHNLRFEKDWLSANSSFLTSRVDLNGHLLPDQFTPTGYVGDHFSVGPALLWAPSLAVVHGVVLVLDHFGAHIAADGFSRPYLIAMAVTTAIYGFLGLWLSFLLARKYTDAYWALPATLGIWCASSLPVYMYLNPSWSHAQSAFGVALFLWYWDRTRANRSLGQWLLLGMIAGLMVNIYYPNAIFLIVLAVEAILGRVWMRNGTARNSSTIAVVAWHWLLFAVVFVAALMPTLITREIIYGSLTASGYPPVATWNWTSPALTRVLFSSDHGLLSWTPILLPAIIGLFFLWKRDRILGASLIVSFFAFYYFIASYPDWDGLSAFGNRFFVSLTPLFVLGLAASLAALGDWMRSRGRALAVAGPAIGLLAIWNLGFIYQWGTHLIPVRGPISWSQMAENQFGEVPTHFSRDVKVYFFRRHLMMQQIEQEDIEQQLQQHKGGN